MSSIKRFECVICYRNKLNMYALATECNHHFCYECLVEWIYVNQSCPICRASITILDLDNIIDKNMFQRKKDRKKLLAEIKLCNDEEKKVLSEIVQEQKFLKEKSGN